MDGLDNLEHFVITIIVKSGEAKSSAFEAIQFAKKGEFDKASELLNQSNENLASAHQMQTSLIQTEAGGNKTEVTLLMVHAQDHLMTAMTVRDLAREIVELYENKEKK